MTLFEHSVGRFACLLALAGLWGCDIPTDAPKFEQEWRVPLTDTSIDVVEMLPNRVGLTLDASAFTVQVDPISFEDDLGSLCPACAGLDGLTVPKPAFDGDFHESIALPADVESVEVQEGRVVVEARNRLSFDPLRPPGGQRGSFTLTLRDGGPSGPILDEVVVDGEATSFGEDASLVRELEYSGPVSSSLSITVNVNSPAGGPEPGNWVLVRLSDEVEVTATPQVIEASSAEVVVADQVFDFGVASLNVEDLDQEVVDRVVSGSIELEVVNPWAVGAVLNLNIIGPTMAAPVVLIAAVPGTPTSVVEVEFTREELQSFLGEPEVVITGQGTVNQDAGIVTLAPGQIMNVEATLDLVIQIG